MTHKYGIEIPHTIDEAFKLDKKSKDKFQCDAVNKETKNLKVAFDILPKGKSTSQTYYKASNHIIFDIRMIMERKVRWVKDSNRTPKPGWLTYVGVVSRESVRIAFKYASLNDLSICGYNI